MWTSLRWNLGNTLAIAAFCLLPLAGLAGVGSGTQTSAEDARIALSASGNHPLTACSQYERRHEAHGLDLLDRA